MASVKLYTADGTTKGEIELDDRLFGVKVNPALIHEAVVHQMNNARNSVAHTKTRGEVAGTGKKPWKQKGTGRARHGSRRSPIWSGGGITFGPRNSRVFNSKMNQKARRKAISMVLSDKVVNDRFFAIEDLTIDEGKTKNLLNVLKNLSLAEKKVLIVDLPTNKLISRAAKNVQSISTTPVNALNMVDLLKGDYVLMSQKAIESLSEIFIKG